MSFDGFSTTSKGELQARPAWRAYFLHYFAIGFALLIDIFKVEVAVFIGEYFGLYIDESILLGIHILLLAVPAYALYRIAKHRLERKYRIENSHRLILEFGIISKAVESIPLSDVTISIRQSIAGRIFGFGDLLFRPGTGDIKVFWEGIVRPDSLRTDLQNLKPGQRLDEKEETVVTEASWYEGLSNDHLSDHAIVVPHPPAIFSAVEEQRLGPPNLGTFGLIHQWHRSGEEMMSRYFWSVVAPTEGQFKGSTYSLDTPSEQEFLAQHGLKDKDLLCFFIPRKGQMRDFLWADFYEKGHVDKAIGKHVRGKPLRRRFKNNKKAMTELVAAYEDFMNRKLPVVAVAELPRLHPDLEPKSFTNQ